MLVPSWHTHLCRVLLFWCGVGVKSRPCPKRTSLVSKSTAAAKRGLNSSTRGSQFTTVGQDLDKGHQDTAQGSACAQREGARLTHMWCCGIGGGDAAAVGEAAEPNCGTRAQTSKTEIRGSRVSHQHGGADMR